MISPWLITLSWRIFHFRKFVNSSMSCHLQIRMMATISSGLSELPHIAEFCVGASALPVLRQR